MRRSAFALLCLGAGMVGGALGSTDACAATGSSTVAHISDREAEALQLADDASLGWQFCRIRLSVCEKKLDARSPYAIRALAAASPSPAPEQMGSVLSLLGAGLVGAGAGAAVVGATLERPGPVLATAGGLAALGLLLAVIGE